MKSKGFTQHHFGNKILNNITDFIFRLIKKSPSSTKSGAGFTLIELLVVISIIGLLASVVLVALAPVRRKARDTRRKADIRQIQTALALYHDKYGYYPQSAQAADDPAPAACSGPDDLNTILSEFMVSVHDPQHLQGDQKCYYYNGMNNWQGYVVMAYGAELPETEAESDPGCYNSSPGYYVYCKGVNY